VPLNLGDDMAAIDFGSTLALLKTDQCLDQVHFDTRAHSAAQIGAKAVNRCLSDCAAMACYPAAIMIAVALPNHGPAATEDFARELFLACQSAAATPPSGTSVWRLPSRRWANCRPTWPR
jgi:thiamine monophosphate kinase